MVRTSTFNNASEQHALNHAIGAISDELLSRSARRTNGWLIVLTALTVFVAFVTLNVEIRK